MRKLPLIIVEWDDVSSFGGWKTRGESLNEEKPFKARMVGWEIARNKNYITVATAFADDDDCNGRRCIPRGCITSIRRLE